ncbi:MAG: TlpA family protein disulfide reductase [Anaerolineales bacterium]|nr:TlpA family protein disulfide reductase [Anaerolineales bacterium]
MDSIENASTDNNEESPGTPSRPKWGAVLVWVFVLGLLAVLGIGLVRTQRGSIRVGDRVPDLILTTFEGDEINFADLHGQIIVVNFWASWCKPCEQEAVELEQAYQVYKDQGVVFLGVDYVDTETEARAYLAKFGITYPNGPDLGTRISQAFRIIGVPETYIIGPDGRLAAAKIGPYLSLDEIVNQIETVMAEQ